MSSFEKDFNKAMAAARKGKGKGLRIIHGMDRGSTRGRVTQSVGGNQREVIGDRLFSGKAWTLERVTRPNGTGFYQLTDLVGGRTDYPVRYHDGTIAYDSPGNIPKSVRNWTERLLERFESKGVHGMRARKSAYEKYLQSMIGRRVRDSFYKNEGTVIEWSPMLPSNDILVEQDDGRKVWWGSQSMSVHPADNKGPLPTRKKAMEMAKRQTQRSLKKIAERWAR